MLCALDTRNVGTLDIVQKIKDQFPALQDVSITTAMVERRINILDQRVDCPYFKDGIRLAKRSVETGELGSTSEHNAARVHA